MARADEPIRSSATVEGFGENLEASFAAFSEQFEDITGTLKARVRSHLREFLGRELADDAIETRPAGVPRRKEYHDE